MQDKGSIEVRFFSFLQTAMSEKGIQAPVRLDVPVQGLSGLEVARELGLPTDRIEAVFRNGLVQDLQAAVFPGDRVAFVPPGTPGPYRVLLGIAGKGSTGVEPDAPGKDEQDPPA